MTFYYEPGKDSPLRSSEMDWQTSEEESAQALLAQLDQAYKKKRPPIESDHELPSS